MITRCRQKVPNARKIFAGWNASVPWHSISAPDVASCLPRLLGLTADRLRNLNRGVQLTHSDRGTHRADVSTVFGVWVGSWTTLPFNLSSPPSRSLQAGMRLGKSSAWVFDPPRPSFRRWGGTEKDHSGIQVVACRKLIPSEPRTPSAMYPNQSRTHPVVPKHPITCSWITSRTFDAAFAHSSLG